MTPLESLLAVALTLRGARVHFFLCDQFLPACMLALSTDYDTQEFVNGGLAARECPRCFGVGYSTYQPLQLPIHTYSQFVSQKERVRAAELANSVPTEQIASYQLNGLAVGEHALAGALRYFAIGELDNELLGEAVLRRYFEASLLTAFATERLVSRYNFAAAVFHHGIYVPQGIIGEVARRRQVRVVNWSMAYRKQCFIFSHNDSYHHTLRDEPTSAWDDMMWDETLEAEVMEYLNSRWLGTRDWISFHENPKLDTSNIAQELGIDFAKPTIGLLTSVMWDAQLHYPTNAFPNMRVWLEETIKYFARRPDLQLLIRIHPAEITGTVPSRQRMMDVINAAFPQLPPNVYVIPPESPLSTYAAMLECDSVIIYGTKTGVELTSYGLPVVVGGEAWIRNKGLTLDASTPQEYFTLLDHLPLGHKLEEDTLRRARMYAYHFFFRRMIPLQSLVPNPKWPPLRLNVERLDDLRPGCDPGLDVICEGILRGTPFIYPAEQLSRNELDYAIAQTA